MASALYCWNGVRKSIKVPLPLKKDNQGLLSVDVCERRMPKPSDPDQSEEKRIDLIIISDVANPYIDALQLAEREGLATESLRREVSGIAMVC